MVSDNFLTADWANFCLLQFEKFAGGVKMLVIIKTLGLKADLNTLPRTKVRPTFQLVSPLNISLNRRQIRLYTRSEQFSLLLFL